MEVSRLEAGKAYPYKGVRFPSKHPTNRADPENHGGDLGMMENRGHWATVKKPLIAPWPVTPGLKTNRLSALSFGNNTQEGVS